MPKRVGPGPEGKEGRPFLFFTFRIRGGKQKAWLIACFGLGKKKKSSNVIALGGGRRGKKARARNN